jgi:uncharacterized protein YqeY
MSLQNKVNEDIKEAMKSKEAVKLSTLRILKNAIGFTAVQNGSSDKTLPDSDVMVIIRKQISMRQDAVNQFTTGNRMDLVEKEKAEIDVLKTYLPPEMELSELENIVDGVILELGATSKKEMGNVMKKVLALVNGRADNKTVSSTISQKLT